MKLLGLLIRFGTVGFFATAIHYGTSFAALAAGCPPLLANFTGFSCAFAVAFSGHLRFTFRRRTTSHSLAMLKYAAVSSGSFICGQVLLATLSSHSPLPAQVALFLSLLFVTALNFLLSNFWAFSRSPETGT